MAGLVLCAALAAATAVVEAQYFGQNKVQYEHFAFQVLHTDSFDIYHYPEEAVAVGHAARLAEQWRSRLARDLGFTLLGRQPLVLYASHPHFTQTQAISGLIGEGTGGVTESLKRRMVLPFGSTLGETSHVLGHEMVHAFQYSAGTERMNALPLWFIEGMAEFLSIGPDDPQTAMWLRDLAQQETLPGFKELDRPRYFPYRFGHAAWAYLAARFGSRIVAAAFLEGARTGDAIRAIEGATGVAIDQLSADWQAAIRSRHGEARDGAVAGTTLVAGEAPRGGGTLNVSPALSPDGKWLAYLSERGLFSIDLYIADAATGRVTRRLTKTDTDPHVESLQFIASAGAWDASSTRFAYASVTRGHATLEVVDVTGKTQRSFTLGTVDEAWHPSWAPDGRAVAFAGLSGGTSDLYVLELKSGTVRRLTNDAFADLQPVWSPDGRQLAFVTDRFTSSLDTLSFGDPRLGVLTVATGAIAPLPALARGKHINPQWDADGGGLFLVANPDGVANVYHLDLAAHAYARVTDVGTGVSGITELSPALSYAPRADRLAFSVFRGGGYDIRVLDRPLHDRSPATTAVPDERSASLLFAPRAGPATRSVFAAPAAIPGTEGARAPAVDVTQVEPYRPALSLDLAGAAGGIGVSNRYGAYAGGGVGMQFSDMLGDHTLGVYLSANGGVRDLGGQAAYINRASRWNWGAAAMVLPYVTGAFGQTVTETPNGQLVIQEQEYLIRQTDADVRAIAAYPFSRALRLEVQGGGQRVWFGRELTTRTYDYGTGRQLTERREDFAAPAALNLAEGAAALVYDQSVFGPTSPISGQRYRFEVTPTAGSLRFTGVALDYRRYLPLVRPVTLAVRGLHLGRYGPGAEDARLSPLFLGYPSLVHGYDVGSFDIAKDCGSALDGQCPAFEELLGSRLLIGNAELRFPLLGIFSGSYHYGRVPIEGFLFGDSGVAWTSGLAPAFADGPRRFKRSAGGGVRVNAFGYAVLELALAKPFDRERSGWVFGFNVMPGF